MFLSDRHLRDLAKHHELISPFRSENCEGASINLTLDSQVKRYVGHSDITFGRKEIESDYEVIDISESEFLLNPGESVLVQSIEFFKIPNNMIGIVLERYSIKLLGIMISPASYMNPGYEGRLSFLAVNHSPRAVKLVPGIKFCQLVISELSTASDTPYNKQDARYLGATEVSISKLHLDREIQDFLSSKGIDNVADETAKQLGNHLLALIDDSATRIAEELKAKFGEPR